MIVFPRKTIIFNPQINSDKGHFRMILMITKTFLCKYSFFKMFLIPNCPNTFSSCAFSSRICRLFNIPLQIQSHFLLFDSDPIVIQIHFHASPLLCIFSFAFLSFSNLSSKYLNLSSFSADFIFAYGSFLRLFSSRFCAIFHLLIPIPLSDLLTKALDIHKSTRLSVVTDRHQHFSNIFKLSFFGLA